MILEGDNSVIDAIKEKKRLMDAGEAHGHIRPLLIVGGGMMQGVYGAGACLALVELDLQEVFVTVAGTSSGAATAAYLYAKNPTHAASTFSEECITRKFIHEWRWGNPMDVLYFKSILEGATGKGIGELSSDHLSRLRVSLSEYETGAPFLLRPNSVEELIDGVTASIAMPGPVRDVTGVRGVRYADGASTLPHAMSQLVHDPQYTHILYIVNQDQTDNDVTVFEKIINNTFYRHRMNTRLRHASNMRRKTDMQFIATLLQNGTTKSCVVWGDRSIPGYTRNAGLIKSVLEKSRQWWLELLQ